MPRLPYNHPFRSFTDLTQHLVDLGMQGDYDEMHKRLMDVGYQRLKPYWTLTDDGRLIPDEFSVVWNRYCFDRQLRLVLMDAIERIEVGIRNRLAHYLAEEYDNPFAYCSASVFTCGESSWNEWFGKIKKAAEKSKIKQIIDFRKTYSNEDLPIWLVCEVMDFGSLVFLYQHVKPGIQKKVSRSLHLPTPDILLSWMRALNDVRNACAHHNRVWNRTWVKSPKLPKNEPNWYFVYDEATREWRPSESSECSFIMSKTGGILTVCQRLMREVASTSHWREERVFPLFRQSRFVCVPHKWLGLPSAWMSHPLWR